MGAGWGYIRAAEPTHTRPSTTNRPLYLSNMLLSTLTITTLVAAVHALDTSSPFVLKVHKPGSDIDGTRLAILEEDMYLSNDGGMYQFTLSNNGSMITSSGEGIEFDHDDEVETSSKGRKITAGVSFNDQDILQVPGNDMGLVACPVQDKEAEYSVKAGGTCQNGITFEAKAENDNSNPPWPKSGDTNSDVDSSKPFGLVAQADGQDFKDMALVMLDGEMWLSDAGDASYTLDNGVLKTSYGKGIEFDHDDQVETDSKKATTGVSIENGELKVPGNDMGFRLCPKQGDVAPYEVKSGGSCTNGIDITVRAVALDNKHEFAGAQGSNSSQGSDKSSTGDSTRTSGASGSSGASSTRGSASSTRGSASSTGDSASATRDSASSTVGSKAASTSDSGSAASPTAENAGATNLAAGAAVAVGIAAMLI